MELVPTLRDGAPPITDIIGHLRKLADEIEKGDWGNVHQCVVVTDNGKSSSFSASVSLPSGTGPFPAVVVYGGFADTATIKAAGAAVINTTRTRKARKAPAGPTNKVRFTAFMAPRAPPACCRPGAGA